MKNIDELFAQKKQELDNLSVPEDMETRLREVLKQKGRVTSRKRRNSWIMNVAAILLITVLIGYNFNTLAYYSKRLIGYDTVMNGTLKELNKLGKGQIIEKSYTFKNGVTIILDGIMIDENQMLVFYTVRNPKGNIDSSSYQSQMQMKGLFERYHMRNGQGKINDEKTEIKWISSFEAPSFYERNLTFTTNMVEEGAIEEGEITFKIDRSKAMTHSLKKKIKETFEKGNTKVRLDTIVASPTRTVINGSIQNTLELAKNQIMGERIRPNYVTLKLVANGEEVLAQSSGMSTNLRGITFHQEFDSLPEDLQTLEIHLDNLSIDTDASEEIKISKNTKNLPLKIKEKDVEINKVEVRGDSTYVTITSQEDILLTRVNLLVDGEKVELKETITSKYDKLPDGTILHTRTLCFPATGEDLVLRVERISFVESFEDVIEVPVE